MKKIKRINILVVCFALLAIAFAFNFHVNVNAADKKVSNDGGSYYVNEVKDDRDLGYGVHYHRDIATASVDQPGYCNSQAAGLGGGGSTILGKGYLNQVNVLEVKPSADVELVPYAYLERSNWHTSSVRDAAEQYEMSHPGQKVIAAVNGDFFHIGDDVKASTGSTVGQGEFYKAVSHHGGGQNIAIKNSGSGKQLSTIHIPWGSTVPTLTIYDENGNELLKKEVAKVNAEPGEGEIAFYYATRQADFHARMDDVTAKDVWFVNDAAQAVTAVQNSFYGKGEITEFIKGEIKFGPGKFAVKSNDPEVDKLLKKGVTIRCQYEFGGENKDVKAAIGFPFTVLENGKPNYGDYTRHPRTIIGQREDGTMILTVIDGRQPEKDMYGATSCEMAALMEYYGCVDAWNLDGGGSSTLLVRKQAGWDYQNGYEANKHEKSSWYVTNSPSDGSERRDGNCLLIVVKVPEAEMSVTDITANSAKINVVLLTTLEKYKDLYIMINNKTYKVENGSITVEDLKAHENYSAYLFAKVDGEMRNLMSDVPFITNYEYPTDMIVDAVISNRKGVDYVLLKYRYENQDGVQNIMFKIGDKQYGTSNNGIYVDQTIDIYDLLLNIDLTVVFKGSNMAKNEELTFENVTVKFDTNFAYSEILFRNNNFINNIFK